MKKLITGFISLALLYSCKKDNTVITTAVTATAPAAKRIRSLSYVYDNGAPEVKTLTYDAMGRVSSYSNGTMKETFEYQSPATLLVTRRLISNNSTDRTVECTLNDKGAVTQMIFKDPAGQVTYTYVYTYSADGYIISYKGSNGSSNYEVISEITGGNILSSKVYFNGVLTYNDKYSTSTVANTHDVSFAGYWPAPVLFGKPLKNMVAELKEYKAATGELNWHTKNTYQLNSAGYAVNCVTDFVTSNTKGISDYELE